MAYEVSIRTLPPQRALTLDYQGDYRAIGQAFMRAGELAGQRGLLGPGAKMVGLYYDDPATVPAAQLRARAGFILPGEPAAEAPFEATPIPGGRYAMLTYRGPYQDMRAAYDWLYQGWPAQAGERPGAGPAMEVYLNTPMDTAPADLLTEIYVPLA
jgi:AraC family transcriptional regulator